MSINFVMTGRVALITRAAGGLGRATAIAPAKAGADVCPVALNLATGNNLASVNLTGALNYRLAAIPQMGARGGGRNKVSGGAFPAR